MTEQSRRIELILIGFSLTDPMVTITTSTTRCSSLFSLA
jgi:hypothetical protein